MDRVNIGNIYDKIRALNLIRRLSVPTYRSNKWNDYEIKVRPTGFRRCLRFFPYFSGSNIKLLINVKTISGKKLEFSYKWRVFRYDGQKEYPIGDWVEHSYIKRPTNEAKDIYNDYLVTYGQYSLQLFLDNKTGKLGNTGNKAMAVFSILERDKYIPAIFFSLISLVFGYCLSWLVQWILSD